MREPVAQKPTIRRSPQAKGQKSILSKVFSLSSPSSAAFGICPLCVKPVAKDKRVACAGAPWHPECLGKAHLLFDFPNSFQYVQLFRKTRRNIYNISSILNSDTSSSTPLTLQLSTPIGINNSSFLSSYYAVILYFHGFFLHSNT